ncbi:interleukin-21 [Corythoichthys intestinalis]|uniref:interleukin-21 n=1 Tax=Corythoichthys intestinalis TaxID=161448 RepID=UPI0025A54CA8|nr:interleukin-21 [Corythoichthys intestinalis]XP_061793292.1 interleukin-21 [Nerophis lumbriciformis]
MILIFLCLAVCCSLASTNVVTLERRKLVDVLNQLGDVKDSLQTKELLVNTPPQNIEDCCCLSALRCFQESLQGKFNMTERMQNKFYRGLKHPITERGLDLCKSGYSASCGTCDSHPKASAKEFVNRLELLLQRAIARLSGK